MNQQVIVSAFNRLNKSKGFFRITIGQAANPKLLDMGQFNNEVVAAKGNTNNFSRIRASNDNVFIVKRQSATQSPNFFVTSDFKSFTQISHLSPEVKYSWLTSELVNFYSLDSSFTQGVLYKPENFDASKRYPVIIHIYEKLSDELNAYHFPEPVTDFLNIPFFVSNGYLVFTPDIHYKIGYPGNSAYNAVMGAMKCLEKYKWVDSSKIGLQGHSWGGYEVNFIVTQTSEFAAAMSSSGPSNFVSGYGSIQPQGGMSLQYFYELHQSRIGPNLWEGPDLYIKNSPVFFADKVNTPLLMMNNIADGIVPFAQGVELFTALRRLGKRVWMLQYDQEAHGISNHSTAIVHTQRLMQFFDHYLKDSAAPKWMTRGICAADKGIVDGLELDYEIKTPGEGLLTPEEKKKVEALQNRKPITIKLE